MAVSTLGDYSSSGAELNGSGARAATPAARPGVAASPSTTAGRSAVASSAPEPEVVAVGSGTDQRLTLVDTATGKVSGTVDVGLPAQRVALAKQGEREFRRAACRCQAIGNHGFLALAISVRCLFY